jgi:hypothetical protein
MKTVILDSNNVVVNIGMGVSESPAPEGLTYIVVADDVWVGPGCKQAEDGSFYDPNPPVKEE